MLYFYSIVFFERIETLFNTDLPLRNLNTKQLRLRAESAVKAIDSARL